MARELGAGPEAMASGLENYRGVARRLESHGKISVAQGGAFLVDDYAHHPAEIVAAAEAARGAHPGRKLLLVFQPHRYTRTRDVFSELVSALCLGDGLVLLPVYPAGEPPLPGADSDALAAALKKRGADAVRVDDLPSAADAVRRTASDGGVVMTMGAGDVGGLPAMLKEAA